MEFLLIFAVAIMIMIPVTVVMVFNNRAAQRDLEQRFVRLEGRVGKHERQFLEMAASEFDGREMVSSSPEELSAVDQSVEIEVPPPEESETSEQTDYRNQEAADDPTLERHTVSVEPSHNEKPTEKDDWFAAAENVSLKSASAFEKIEGDLSTKWMIWVGGIALALGGGFLVKYSIDANLLDPAVRVTLGTLFGLLLTGGGEMIRRRRSDISWLDDTPDYLPSAISAAGLFTLFASIYGAYALYDLLPTMIAFVALAGVSLAASALAYVQGRFFAYLGLVAGMVVPAMVSTGSGNAWALFPYLLFITAATLAVARQRGWSGVAGSSLSMATLWAGLWMLGNWHTGDGLPVGLYLLILGGLNIWLLQGATPERSTNPTFSGLMPGHSVSKISDSVILLAMIFLVAIVRLEHYSTVSLVLFTAGLIGQAYAVMRNPEHDAGGLAALLASLFLLLTWHVPDLFELQDMLGANEAMHFALSPIAPPGFENYTTAAVLLAGSIGFGLYYALPWLLRKPLWATVAAAYPIVVLIIAYGRLNDFETSIPFAAIAMLLGGLFTATTVQLNKLDKEIKLVPVAAYAAGATSAMALALTMLLRDAWLSTALAIEIVALAHIWRMTKVEGLRTLALGLATVVLVRLFFNGSIFDYGDGEPLGIINWLWYGYGLTAALFAYAARLFEGEKETGYLLSALKAGATLLLVAFISGEISVLFSENGRLLGSMTALEAALQTVNWSIATTVLFWRETQDGNKVFGYLRRFMTLVSLFGLIVLGGLSNNILFGRVDVGEVPIFNIQLLQFLVPGLLYAFKARIAETAGKSRSQTLYGGVAFLTLFFWVTVEVRHFFYPTGGYADASGWETYAYSLAWLGYAVALLAAGIKLEVRKLRMAGLGLLGFVVLKVFLFDMNNLEGIARALSFMGLGATLIGMGFLYQYFRKADGDEASSIKPAQ